MQITATLVKELRERTGAGMMECKKALVETEGDIDAAAELMRKSGQAKADKKAGRVAAEGAVFICSSDESKSAVMLEVNSETDFVSKGDDFNNFSNAVAQLVLDQNPADVAALMELPLDASGISVEQARANLVGKIGENIQVRRFSRFENADGLLGSYKHGIRIGVVVALEGGDDSLARDIAMHVAASKPVCISADQVPTELLEGERNIFKAQAEESGKPAEIIEKMIEGRVRKYLSEITLLGQAFVKDPDQSVEKLLKGAGARVTGFERFEVGEGIEKKTDNFAEEVMAQARGN